MSFINWDSSARSRVVRSPSRSPPLVATSPITTYRTDVSLPLHRPFTQAREHSLFTHEDNTTPSASTMPQSSSFGFLNAHFALRDGSTTPPTQYTGDPLSGPEQDAERSDQCQRHINNLLTTINCEFDKKTDASTRRLFLRPVDPKNKASCIYNFSSSAHNPDKLPTDWCRLCLIQYSPSELTTHTWDSFPPQLLIRLREPLSSNPTQHLCRLDCTDCFPRQQGTQMIICRKCVADIEREKIPTTCRLTMLREPCVHLFPPAVEILRPLEERFLAAASAFAMITKLSLDPETKQPSSVSYRKIIGHTTVLANDVVTVAKVLPRSLEDVMGDVHILWCSPNQPEAEDLLPHLGLRKPVMMAALRWLMENNHLYIDINTNNDFWDMWGDSDEIVPIEVLQHVTHIPDPAQEAAERSGYVPSQGSRLPTFDVNESENERAESEATMGEPDELDETTENPYPAEELLDGSDIDENDWAQAIRDGKGTAANDVLLSGEPSTNESCTETSADTRQEPELFVMASSSGFFSLGNNQANDAEKAVFIQESLRATEIPPVAEGFGNDPTFEVTERRTVRGQPYLRVCLGDQFITIRDPHFFAKIFITIFPYGWGGPVALSNERQADEDDTPEQNFSLRTWASIKLRQHGGAAATHPVFPFLVFNQIMKNNSGRISRAQVKKSSFHQIRTLSESITREELLQASQELQEHKPISNPNMQKLLKEIAVFGRQQPLSNEEKVHQRNMIKSLILRHGLPAIWFTVNPNDLSSPIRIEIGRRFRSSRYLHRIQQRLDRCLLEKRLLILKEVNQDPVSTVRWFHSHIETFFREIVRADTMDGAFGPVHQYFGAIETNGRGAFHLHGFLWFFGNIGIENLITDTIAGGPEEIQQFLTWVDEHFQEDFDHEISRLMSQDKTNNRLQLKKTLRTDLDRLSAEWEQEAQYVATASQAHKCGVTCYKYAKMRAKARKGRHMARQCRFGWPWPLIERTHIDDNGVLRIRRRSRHCTRWNKVIATALRHNHDFAMIFTKTQTLALLHYITNYATKLEAPTYQRLALLATHFDALMKSPDFIDNDDRNEVARSLMIRISNRIFSERELSSIDVCNYILGYDTFYCSESQWRWMHCESLYWAVRNQWDHLQELASAANDENTVPTAEPLISLDRVAGVKPSIFEAYRHRGPVLRHLCLYDYASLVDVVTKPHTQTYHGTGQAKKWTASHVEFIGELATTRFCQKMVTKNKIRTPLLTGKFPLDFEEDFTYSRSAVLRLSLFIPWEDFLDEDSKTPLEIWEAHKQNLDCRLQFINNNFDLMKKSREDAIQDVKVRDARADWNDAMDVGRLQGDEDYNAEEEDNADDELADSVKDFQQLSAFSEGIQDIVERTQHRSAPIFEPSILQLQQGFHTGNCRKLLDFPLGEELQYYRTMVSNIDIGTGNPLGDNTHVEQAITAQAREWKTEISLLNQRTLADIAGELDNEQQQGAPTLAPGMDVDTDPQADPTLYEPEDRDLIGLNEDPIPQSVTQPNHHRVRTRPATITIEYYHGRSWVDIAGVLAERDGLNYKQSAALHIILQHLDKVEVQRSAESSDSMEDSSNPNNHQLLFYLGGEGGTGKSVVIKTLIKALESKNARRRIMLTATSGSAGAHIGGTTIHSAASLLSSRSRRIPPEKKAAWKQTDILVIDECSMMSGADLDKIHKQLQEARDRYEEHFGGMPIIVLCGDFYQFEPVQGLSLLYPSKPTSKQTYDDTRRMFEIDVKEKDTPHIRGHQLWRQFTNVVLLDQQMRTADARFASLLSRLRRGKQTAEDVDILNTKLARPESISLDHRCRAVTPLNSMRYAMNLQACLAFAKKRGQKVFIFLSEHVLKCAQRDRVNVLSKAFQMMDKSDLKIPAYLPFTKDMPVALTENSHQALKMVNGAEYIAKAFIPSPDSSIYSVNTDIFIITRPPKVILVSSPSTQDVHLDGLDKGLLPLFPSKIYASKRNTSTVPSRPFDRIGYTLTPTFAITEFKAQGQTLSEAFLSLTSRREIFKGADFMATYVQLSRVVGLEGLHLLSPVEKEHWLKLRLPHRMQVGIDRLLELEGQTMHKYHSLPAASLS